MTKVICAMAVSVDGYITGRNPRPGHGLGDGGELFEWFFAGETPSSIFDGFRLSAESAPIFDALAGRIGATVAGRTTYDDSERFRDVETPHPTAPLFVLSHRPAPRMGERQTLITSGIEDAIAIASETAGDKDVGLMGGVVVTQALEAGLVDELILHQVPVLLGAGRRYFHELTEHIALRLVEVVPAVGVTHLHYEVTR